MTKMIDDRVTRLLSLMDEILENGWLLGLDYRKTQISFDRPNNKVKVMIMSDEIYPKDMPGPHTSI